MKPLVIFNNREFFGIEEFDCLTVYLYTEPTLRGTFLTSIPISNLEYRKLHPTPASVEISTDDEYTTFKIVCDWGSTYVMKIHNSLSEKIEFAKQQAIIHELLKV